MTQTVSMFDPRLVPASAPDSWLALTGPTGWTGCPPGLYVRTCHNSSGGEAFLIELLDGNGMVLPAEPVSTPGMTFLESDTVRAELAFAPGGSLRIRVRGGRLRLTMQHLTSYAPLCHRIDARRLQVSLTILNSQFALTCLAGRLDLDAPWAGDHSELGLITLAPADGTWAEMALEDMQSSWPATEHRESFQEVVERREVEYATFCSPLPPVPPGQEAARELAGYIMWSCGVPQRNRVVRPVILMSKAGMNRVWSWDHCFNALGLCTSHPDLAWHQFQAFVEHQDADGCLPDCYNAGHHIWEFVKPPIHGWALLRMMEWADPGIARLKEAYEPLVRWTRWWMNHRDHDGDGLVEIHHGNDTGADNSTLMGLGMPLASPEITADLVVQLDCLAKVARRLGRNWDADLWSEQSARLLATHQRLQWAEGEPRAVVPGRGAQPQPGDALQPWMSVILGERLPPAHATACTNALSRLRCCAGLATESQTSPRYERDGYWRGPAWGAYTLIGCDGLRRCGQESLARSIAGDFMANCARSGFAENFAADDGAPLRDKAYTWTAGVYLTMAARFR